MSDTGYLLYRRATEDVGLKAVQSFKDFVCFVSSLWQSYLEQRERRDAFLNLQRLDDRMLADIGLNRLDVEWAANRPLNRNAGQELDALHTLHGVNCVAKSGRRISKP